MDVTVWDGERWDRIGWERKGERSNGRGTERWKKENENEKKQYAYLIPEKRKEMKQS